jgi:AAA15 family ATPase/GTPase
MLKNEYVNKIQEVENIKSIDMITEWNDKQNKFVDKEIKRLFIMKTLEDHRENKRTMYTYNSIEDFFWLALYIQFKLCNVK